MDALPSFEELATTPDPALDVVCLALAAEFRDVDAARALTTLDELGDELGRAAATAATPEDEVRACGALLAGTYGFAGDADRYDDPRNSMLDVVLERRRGLPILLSALYVEVARRAGIEIAGVGLPGHFVAGHFGADPPLLLDPFNGGALIAPDVAPALVRRWHPHEIALRMLNNLVPAFQRRGNVAAAIRAAELRLALPTDATLTEALQGELLALQARLN